MVGPKAKWGRVALLAGVALALLMPAAGTRANSITLYSPSVGTEVFYGQPYFEPGIGINYFNQYGYAYSALLYDLSFIPRGTTISSATFTMSVRAVQTTTSAGAGMSIYSYAGTGPKVTETDFNLPVTYQGTMQGLPRNSDYGSDLDAVTTFNVTSLVQSLVNNGTPYAGFQTRVSGTVLFPGSTPISLSITSPSTLVVPEPRSVLLLSVGLGGLLAAALARAVAVRRRALALATNAASF